MGNDAATRRTERWQVEASTARRHTSLPDGPYPFIQTGDDSSIRRNDSRTHPEFTAKFGFAAEPAVARRDRCASPSLRTSAETGNLNPIVFPGQRRGFTHGGISGHDALRGVFHPHSKGESWHSSRPRQLKKTSISQCCKESLFRLPPLAEQHRIVAEVERRLSVIEELEAAGRRQPPARHPPPPSHPPSRFHRRVGRKLPHLRPGVEWLNGHAHDASSAHQSFRARMGSARERLWSAASGGTTARETGAGGGMGARRAPPHPASGAGTRALFSTARSTSFFLPTPPQLTPLAAEYRRLPGVTPGHESPPLRLAVRQMVSRRESALALLEELGRARAAVQFAGARSVKLRWPWAGDCASPLASKSRPNWRGVMSGRRGEHGAPPPSNSACSSFSFPRWNSTRRAAWRCSAFPCRAWASTARSSPNRALTRCCTK